MRQGGDYQPGNGVSAPGARQMPPVRRPPGTWHWVQKGFLQSHLGPVYSYAGTPLQNVIAICHSQLCLGDFPTARGSGVIAG